MRGGPGPPQYSFPSLAPCLIACKRRKGETPAIFLKMQDGPAEILKTAAYSYPYDPPAYSGKPREERQKFHFSPPFSHSRANAAQYPGYVRRRGEGGKNRAEGGEMAKKRGRMVFRPFSPQPTMIAGGLSFPSRTYHEKVDSDQAKGVQKGIVFEAGGSRKRHQHYIVVLFPPRHIHVRAHKSPGIPSPPPLLPTARRNGDSCHGPPREKRGG